MRVVFDASKKTENGKSLNDILLTGPAIQSDIVSILINWRFHRVAFITCIKMMYRDRQVLADEFDMNFNRIIWRNNVFEPVGDYCMNRLTFGVSSAAYIAIRTMHQLAYCEKANYLEAAEIILHDAYVDDIMSG